MKTTQESNINRAIRFTFDTTELAKCETVWISGLKIGDKTIFGGDLFYFIHVHIPQQGKPPIKFEMNRGYRELEALNQHLTEYYDVHFLPHFPTYYSISALILNQATLEEKLYEMQTYLRKLFSQYELFFKNEYFRYFFEHMQQIEPPPKKLIKTVVATGSSIANAGKSLLVKGWNSIWKGKTKRQETQSAEDRKYHEKLLMLLEDQSQIVKIIAKGIDEANKVKSSLETTVSETTPTEDLAEDTEFATVITEFQNTLTDVTSNEKKTTTQLTKEVIWPLQDVHLDAIQAVSKIKDFLQQREQLEKAASGLSDETVKFKLSYLQENERILSKEISHFSKRADDNVREVVRVFLEVVQKISKGASNE